MNNGTIIGIISDTHDNRAKIIKAVKEFNNTGCQLVIHAGDFVAPFTIREFEKLACPLIGVYGNNDGERKGLAAQFSKIGSLHDPPHEFEFGGKRFAVMHDPTYLERYIGNDTVNVVIYGHTHKIDIRQGKPLIINPGESCSWLTDHSTIVLLNSETLETKLVNL
ncbi:hypothetical protein ES708_10348 [subsurface metagenome]